MKFAFLAFLAFLANSIVSSESFAKPIKIIGSCRGAEGDQVSAEDCEVLAVDGFRTVKTGTAGKLRAGFVVYGFKPSGKPIEWRDDTEVFWVLCSVSTPVVMSYGEKGLIVGTINLDIPIVAQISDTALYQSVCAGQMPTEQSVNQVLLEKMQAKVTNPFDALK